VEEITTRIDQLANLMQEYHLEDARLAGEDWLVEFSTTSKHKQAIITPTDAAVQSQPIARPKRKKPEPQAPEAPVGDPILSPITGIFYNSPKPDSPTFVKRGDSVTEGQVIGLVEAMKVFNEILAPRDGIASDYLFKSGSLVQPEDALIYLE
jgi:acetyl-CoA carboxylase biotin carboxyl carrier protein